MVVSKNFDLLFLWLLLFFSQNVYSWGGRGHHTICSAAPHLVKNDSLKSFLKFRVHTLGHLCNIPDIHWKSLGPEISEVGNPTHYIDPEIIGLKVEDVPLDIHIIIEKYTGTENLYKNNGKIFSIPKEFGTLWWRADQFYRLISDLKSPLSTAATPKNYKEEQDEKLPYNQSVYNLLLYMGLMGHYVGDASQPFHSTADFDGYTAGHGGIHSYYEELVVTQFNADFEKLIIDKALNNKLNKDKQLVTGSPIEIMKRLSILGSRDRAAVLKLDPIIKKSLLKNEKGMEIKTAAERKSIEVGFAKFKDLIITQMARSAIVLAHFWEESFHNAGSPSLQAYKSYKYPHTPDFIAPDYIGKIEDKK